MGRIAKKRFMKFIGFLWQVYSFVMLRHTNLNFKFLQKRIERLKINKLHIGCGEFKLKGWLNIEFEQREEYGRVIDIDGAYLLNYNLLRTWPIKENSIDYIAASHFIEHFDLNFGFKFAKMCYLLLKKGGIVRISCPDLEIYAKNYVNKNEEFFNNELIREWCCFKAAKYPGEILAAKAYDSGCAHRWFYDFDSLRHILEEAGFKNIKRVGRLEGKTPNLEFIEPDLRQLETLYVEAEK